VIWVTDLSLKPRKSVKVAVVAVLAALHAVLSLFPGIWRRWSIVMMPFEGIIGGPVLGASASIIGVAVGRLAKPEFFLVENFFGVAETVGAMAAGLLFTRRWKIVLVIYAVLLGAFMMHPLARIIPLWTLWNVYIASIATFPAGYYVRKLFRSHDSKLLLPVVALIAFVSVELDVMVRVFILIVLGLYQVYPIPVELLPEIFVAGAFTTPIEAAYVMTICSAVGVPLLVAVERSRVLRWQIG
jgi:hypothetical protein